MSNKKLHIVSFDVPFPANYGGAIDVFYRIKALQKLGFQITLHCFEYGRGKPEELNNFVEDVIYYPRKKSVFDWFSKTPFIVQTRRSKLLLENLLKNNAPILFEGLHTTYFLNHPQLNDRQKFVRAHNIEHDYYFKLAEQTSGWKKWYFNSEAKKLKRYESVLDFASVILPIKKADLNYFSQYSAKISYLAPCFDLKNATREATEPYILFQGNLSVSENIEAVKWISEHIFDSLKARFIVAGKDPDSSIQALEKTGVFELISSPSEAKMTELISKARVHVLVTNQSTGVKLKLINSLQTSGHVLVNPTMVEGTDLENYCQVLQHHYEWKHAISNALKTELSESEFNARTTLFTTELNVLENCRTVFL